MARSINLLSAYQFAGAVQVSPISLSSLIQSGVVI